MRRVRLDAVAREQLLEVHRYSLEQWGDKQAYDYVRSLIAKLNDIAANRAISRPVPAAFEVDGYMCSYRSHIVYWRDAGEGAIEVLLILHQRMNQVDRVRRAFEEGS